MLILLNIQAIYFFDNFSKKNLYAKKVLRIKKLIPTTIIPNNGSNNPPTKTKMIMMSCNNTV